MANAEEETRGGAQVPHVPSVRRMTGQMPAPETVPTVEPWRVETEEEEVPSLEALWAPSEGPEEGKGELRQPPRRPDERA